MEYLTAFIPEESREFVYHRVISKIQGSALEKVRGIVNPTWTDIKHKLKTEYGVREGYDYLFNKILETKNNKNIHILYRELGNLLNLLNKKCSFEPHILYNPEFNEKLVLDRFKNCLDPHIYLVSFMLEKNKASVKHISCSSN